MGVVLSWKILDPVRGPEHHEIFVLTFLNTHRPQIIGEWVERLHTECGEQYSQRPVDPSFWLRDKICYDYSLFHF